MLSNLLLLLLINPVGATEPTPSAFTEIYKTKVLSDVNSAQIVLSNIKNKMRSACPKIKATDISSCFKSQIEPMEIKSTTHLNVLLGIAALASQVDKQSGYDFLTISIMGIDNLLTVLEKLNLTDFHLNEFRPNTTADYMALVALKKNEEKLLGESNKKLFNLIMNKNKEIQLKLDTPNGNLSPQLKQWHITKHQQNQNRIKKIENNLYVFAPTTTSYQRDQLAKFITLDFQKSICLNSRLNQCKQLSLEICQNTTMKYFKMCESNLTQRTPASLSSNEAIRSYMKSIASCASPKIKEALFSIAPGCK